MTASSNPGHPTAGRDTARWKLADGAELGIRPIQPADAPAWLAFLGRLSPPTRYKRAARRPEQLTPDAIRRATDPDPTSEIAYVAVTEATDSAPEIVGVVRLMLKAGGAGAEFLLVVADRWQRKGIGGHLLRTVLAIAAARRLAWVEGNILSTNRGMIEFAERLGFSVEPSAPEAIVTRVVKHLA
jgi:acetyltransferase